MTGRGLWRAVAMACAWTGLLLAAGAARGETTATWIGGDGSYQDPANWNIGAVPINTGTVTYNVVIGGGSTSAAFPRGRSRTCRWGRARR